jgi:heat-inducible transcriptional repressor
VLKTGAAGYDVGAMSTTQPSDRRGAILRALISHYVRSGEPVGSKTLVDEYNLNVSSATVRNELSWLEEEGFISQPHTSAGRIPTDSGYRFFVDTVGSDPKLSPSERMQVESFFGEPRFELEDALRHTAALLSNLTDHAAVVFAPALDRSVVRHVELVSLSTERAMVVVVTDTGRVENHVVSLGAMPDEVQLDQTAELLNRILVGEPLDGAARKIVDGIDRLPLELRSVASAVAAVLAQSLSMHEAERVFLEGTSNIVDEHKFADLETVRQVIGALEHRRLLLEVLAESLAAGSVSIRIGSENSAAEMRSCTVITAPYGTLGHPIGSLGIVGPTRMDYKRTIAAVNAVSVNLGRMLGQLGV